ncbi:general odorant-binding protein 57c-like [Planococcus citri]|uniref:general odorant-binding protein 57c-like n=1 Tax=Planococcus citri TaxID=170843 RepID=UPI0031F814C2
MKIVITFLLLISLIRNNGILGDTNFFKAIAHECNNTFPVTHEIILAPNISKLTENLKNDRNAKCFVHCIFHKLNFLDNKGIVNKSELFENASSVWAKVPEDKKGSIAIPKITPQLKEIVSSIIDVCETKDTVAQETDPCNKFYNFAQCLIDDFAPSET